MLNVAGSSFDFGNVLFAVLQECEHVRRGLPAEEAPGRLMEAARRKLAQVKESYVESGGTPGYWQELEREVLETSLPAYIPEAIEQTRLERSGYGVWRRGDAAARVAFTLLGLAIGGLIKLASPFQIPENILLLLMVLGGFLYPEIKRLLEDWRHTGFLNRMVSAAEKYQKNTDIHYVSEARLEKELDAIGGPVVERVPEEGAEQPPLRLVPRDTERDRGRR